jgi:SAM-dependent methyltransferase
VSSVWDSRADAYRVASEQAEGEDLRMVVGWANARRGVTVLDVATGGGHMARRLREAGADVVTVDASAGMQPDVVCRAEDLPFADGSFDVVVCRIAAHHFEDLGAAVREMARASCDLVLVEDTLYEHGRVEEAERLRDPSHVRSRSEREWRDLFAQAGLTVEEVSLVEKRHPVDEWLERTGCSGEEADQVRELLADRIADGFYVDTKILLRGRK